MNLFDTLENIDKGEYQYFKKLSDIELKSIPAFLLLKWLSHTNDPNKLLRLNLSPNKNIFNLYKHPTIVYNTLVACGSGNKEFYKWKKKSKKISSKPITTQLLMEYYNISNDTAIEDSSVMNLSSMICIAEELGHFDKIEDLRKEY